MQGQPVFHIFGQDGTQATLCSRTGQADCRRFQWLLYRCIGMVAFYFRTPARIPGNMQVWVPAIIFCVLSCMKTGYHDDGPEDMVQSPDRSESLYVTGVEYPSGYDWSSGKYDSTTASLLFLMKDGKRILELPAGKEGGETAREAVSLQEQTCTVHICGAVNAPGVYELPQDSRVVDAVAAGGGFAPDADPEACNLAQPVTDGCQIYIMTQEESALADRGGRNAGIQETEPDAGTDGTGLVNINTADAEQLKTLPGIGDSKAAAILAWREENGRFETIEDIMKVSGIKEGAFSKIRDRIRV